MQPMFELVKGAEKFTPQQESIVIDLSIIPDEKIRGIAEVRAFILALKYSRSTLLFKKMPGIIHLFDGVGAQRQKYLGVLITYLSYAIKEHKRGELSKIVKRELDLGDDIMKRNSNIWAKLGYWAGLEDGEGIGYKKGEKKGEQTGYKKGEHNGFEKGIVLEKQLGKKNEKKAVKSNQEYIALKMLKKGISIEEVCEFTGLTIKEVLVLKKKIKDEGL